ncbi:hypothetical protein [Halomonas sp. BN3-1]|uniref:condensin complex protein MksE n=1 Tax=Halomonas sp. BN3-1 TaxID=2082393 RepID=UPI000D3B3C76|nr:hypothetical protein [Halomonas sp. BN3-1]|tara:strand:- start:239 stop:853 length:615 start_codon:yes stop_codon:yes gene_type:complete
MSDMPFPHEPNTGQPVVNRRLSQEAFRKLTSGQVINQYQYVNGELAPNPLFDELYKERDRYYVEAYANMGMELVQRPGFFYVRTLTQAQADEEGRDQESGGSIRQIQGVLLVLGRGVLEKGFMFDALTHPDAGITREILESIGSDPTFGQILKACKMDQPLPEAVKVALVDRDIAYFNAKGNMVLAEAGKAFFDDLFSQDSSDH